VDVTSTPSPASILTVIASPNRIAEGIEQVRSGTAALLTGEPEDQLDEAAIRGLGSVQRTMISGVIIQWLADPARAPSPEQVVAGLRALAALPGTPPAA
jgi:hypothetical protein